MVKTKHEVETGEHVTGWKMVIFARVRVMTDTDSGGKLYHYFIKTSRQGKPPVLTFS